MPFPSGSFAAVGKLNLLFGQLRPTVAPSGWNFSPNGISLSPSLDYGSQGVQVFYKLRGNRNSAFG